MVETTAHLVFHAAPLQIPGPHPRLFCHVGFICKQGLVLKPQPMPYSAVDKFVLRISVQRFLKFAAFSSLKDPFQCIWNIWEISISKRCLNFLVNKLIQGRPILLLNIKWPILIGPWALKASNGLVWPPKGLSASWLGFTVVCIQKHACFHTKPSLFEVAVGKAILDETSTEVLWFGQNSF